MVSKKPDGSGDPQNQPQKPTGPLSNEALRAAALAKLQAALQAAASDPAKVDEVKSALEEAIKAGVEVAPTLASHETTDNPLRINSRAGSRKVRRNQQRPFCWLKSPGTIIGGVQAKWSFEDNAKARKVKLKDGKVERIRTARKEGDSNIYMWVTDGKDADGFEVEEDGSNITINIADWIFAEEIAPAPGTKQKFDLLPAPELVGGLPALCINLEKVRKTTTFKVSYKKRSDDQNTSTDKLKKESPGTPAPKDEAPAADDENE
ncbi:MAG: hypothetical protein K0R39_4005 [Symbiobacteriaceae bacterium]|jgi:hypothetical protein|nr:hypothetical protein [Symbiobacteriaceae bacterium]